ncbi:telomere length regulation protein TEL2 homolog [Physella acuta]|uniref:telomere length regulation protein TEL2 homolog n=1 Tax=Physella acuta TaxID=109671 RepID=UPI0027DB05C9|nr:telomere length regulation protein TEL2 homolog [Physella acuta]XP_059147319.1 telomere length regulation protein TEL2 homolog [Physella acuta]
MEKDAIILGKEITNGLRVADLKEDLIKWLTVIKSVLVPQALQGNAGTSSVYGYESSTLISLRSAVIKTYGMKIYSCLMSKISVQMLSKLGTENTELFKSIFLEGPPKESFFSLFQAVTDSERKDYKFHKCVSLLEEFLTRQRLAQLLQDESQAGEDGSSSTQVLDVEAEILIGYLTSLPEKMANRLQHENSEKFLPQNYIPMTSLALLDVLQWGHDLVAAGQNVSLLVVSVLVGKLCFTGHADVLLDTLLPQLSVKVRLDYIWCRICERVFAGVPVRTLESVIVPMMKKLSWYGLADKFLGDCVVHTTSVKMLLCTKMLLHRTYSKPKRILHNIIGYLSASHTRRHLLIEVFLNVVRVWGDGSSMKHISVEQHLYISKVLMVCMGAINEVEKKAHKDELMRELMPGVQAHLESSDPTMRLAGMTIAKTLIHTLEPTGPQLEFDLDLNNAVVKDLLEFKDLPADPGPTEEERAITSEEKISSIPSGKVEESLKSLSLEDENGKKTDDDSELDSDDDLEPYDMSNDKKFTKISPPKYVRDCMEGLIYSTKDPDKTELCLQHAEGLIRRATFGLEEIAVEFTKVLLHMEDTHSFENFLVNRFSALVALAVTSPANVAEFLCSQFYEKNYSLRQRMDILEVLGNAAEELSTPEKQKDDSKTKKIVEISPNFDPSDWRQVVQKRIDSNTRRFVHGRSKPEPVPTLNRFAPVASQFFYPLMTKVDRTEPCLDLLGKDHTLLYRLLYTLAIVLHSSINLPGAGQMGRALLEFTWPIRFHSDCFVRQSVLVCTSTVFLVVPAFSLMTDLQADIAETMAWLEDVIERDPDNECQKMAAQTLMLLQGQVKREVEDSKSKIR